MGILLQYNNLLGLEYFLLSILLFKNSRDPGNYYITLGVIREYIA